MSAVVDAGFGRGEHRLLLPAVKASRFNIFQLPGEATKMKELVRTNDPVLLSWLTVLLSDEGIEAVVFDTHTSILEGSANAIPRRLMVIDDDFEAARRVLIASGEGALLV